MRIGRKRNRAAVTAASSNGFPARISAAANPTIRIAFFVDTPIVVTNPTWKTKSLASPVIVAARNAPTAPRGTPNTTENGRDTISLDRDGHWTRDRSEKWEGTG